MGRWGNALAGLAAVAAIGAAVGGPRPEPGPPPAARRPDVVLVVVDTLRADHLDHLGYARRTAPALAGFRARATLFTEALAPAPWTAPSVASLVTGLHPGRHRTVAHGARLPDEATTLAETLGAHGWRTHGICFNIEVGPATGFAQGFDTFQSPPVATHADWEVVSRASIAYPDMGRMVDGVRSLLEAAGDEPLFLYLHPMNVHGPYRVPPDRQAALLGRPPSRAFTYYGPVMARILREGRLTARREVTAAEIASLTEQYDTAIRYTTDRLAEIFALLDRHGRFDDALVVVTADHGEELFEHGGFSHGYSLHRELVHVPLYVKLPRQRTAGTITTRVSLLDLHPTILALLGLPAAPVADGRSLAPLLGGEPGAADAPGLLLESAWAARFSGRAWLRGSHKLVEIDRNYEGLEHATRLYDVVRDPGETRNLAADHPELVAALRTELAARRAHVTHQPLAEPANVLDAMDRRRLEALGYLAP